MGDFERGYSEGATPKGLLRRGYSEGATPKGLLRRGYSAGAILLAFDLLEEL